MLNVFKINQFFEEHEFKESNFIWNTDRYLKVLIGNTVDRRSLGVPICPFYPYPVVILETTKDERKNLIIVGLLINRVSVELIDL